MSMQPRLVGRFSRRGRRLVGSSSAQRLRVAAAVVACSAALGCSTLVTPDGGLGASLTLATVEHVADREDELRREVEATLERRVGEAVDAARAEDQARIETLREELEKRNRELSDVAAALARSEAKVADLADILRAGLEGLALDAERIRATTARLDDEIQRLPYESLRQLSRAIEVHLVSQPLPEQRPRPKFEPVVEDVSLRSNPAPAPTGSAPSGTAPTQGAAAPGGRR